MHESSPASSKPSSPVAAIAVVIALVAIAVLAGLAPVRAAEVEGVGIDDSVEVGGTRLELNGAGMRNVYIVKAYVAALYVPSRSQAPDVLLAQKGPRRLSLTMLADLSAEWFTQRFVTALRENCRDAEFAKLSPRLDRLIETMLTLGRRARASASISTCRRGHQREHRRTRARAGDSRRRPVHGHPADLRRRAPDRCRTEAGDAGSRAAVSLG